MSATVGTGRRYRLPDWLGGHEVRIEAEADDGDKIVTTVHPVVEGERGWVRVAQDSLVPVGLDMAEPDDGTVVRVETEDGYRFVAERDDESAKEAVTPLLRRWFTTKVAGERYIATWGELVALPGVSITVLVPRDDDLRTRLEAERYAAAEKAVNLGVRTPTGIAHRYYADVLAALLNPQPSHAGFSINGRTQADSGE